MRIGIFGGTFDPPHLGHLILAAEALDQGNLDQVLWVLTRNPPHKTDVEITNIEHRSRMIELTIDDNSKFKFSRIEIDREPPQYAVDTMIFLKQHSPNDEFVYLMGLDSLNDLPTWHQPANFVSACDSIVVMMRHGEKLEIKKLLAIIPGLDKKLHFLDTPVVEISATDIRRRVSEDRQYQYFVTDPVYQYIQYQQLYKSISTTG